MVEHWIWDYENSAFAALGGLVSWMHLGYAMDGLGTSYEF